MHEAENSPPGQSYLSVVLKFVVTVTILALLFYVLDAQKLSDALGTVEGRWLMLGCLASAVFVLLRIAKWHELAHANGLHARPADIARASLFGLAVGLVTPARIGEITAVAPFSPSERRRAILVHIYDRVCELFSVVALCVPAAFVLIGPVGLLLSLAFVTIYAVCLVGISTSTWRRRLNGSWLLRRLPSLQGLMAAVLKTSPRYWLLSAASFIIAYVVIVLFMVGIEPIRNWEAVVILPVVTLSNLISITVGGLGVREGLAAALSPSVGLTPEVAAAAFFLSFFWTRVVPGLAGLLWTALRTVRHAGKVRDRGGAS